jgi:hypothetical protein
MVNHNQLSSTIDNHSNDRYSQNIIKHSHGHGYLWSAIAIVMVNHIHDHPCSLAWSSSIALNYGHGQA